MKNLDWLWLIGGVVYGVFLRYIFGKFSHAVEGPMSLAFLIATPVTVGAITIFSARKNNPSGLYMTFFPWITTALMLLGCALTMMEGAICIAILSPLFLICSSFGGLIMGYSLRALKNNENNLKVIVALPFLIMVSESNIPLQKSEMEIKRTITVNAKPKIIWNQILTARQIRPEELPFSIVHLIGVPRPVEGINIETENGEVRFSKWEKGVNFQAKVISKQEYKSITWHYIFNKDSFPAGSMDDHVAIGGEYFDLNDTTFNLTPTDDGKTELEIIAHFKVNSAVNFYALPISQLLGSDFINTILTLYKNRSENEDLKDSKIASR